MLVDTYVTSNMIEVHPLFKKGLQYMGIENENILKGWIVGKFYPMNIHYYNETFSSSGCENTLFHRTSRDSGKCKYCFKETHLVLEQEECKLCEKCFVLSRDLFKIFRPLEKMRRKVAKINEWQSSKYKYFDEVINDICSVLL